VGRLARRCGAALPGDRGARRRFAASGPGCPAAELDRWAGQGLGGWRGALRRFAEDRAPVYVRPEAGVVASLRQLEAAGAVVGVFTDAPEPLARIALAHLGAARRIEHLDCGAAALERLLDRLGADVKVVRSRDELSDLHR
jgi:phosphoglycolate phosphatase-like HAD superfamily hydrolase